MLQLIQTKLEHNNINDTLKYILNKSYQDITDINTNLSQDTLERERQLRKSFELLKERATQQLETLCDYSVKLQKAGIFDNKINIATKQKSIELFKVKERELFKNIIKKVTIKE